MLKEIKRKNRCTSTASVALFALCVSSPMPESGEETVFVDTNMGTHLAMAVSPHISVSDFKRELERVHHSCFPDLGQIKVFDLMVKRKNCFYHLADSMPIMYSFMSVSVKRTRFLHAEVKQCNGLNKQDSLSYKTTKKHCFDGNYVAEFHVNDTTSMSIEFNGHEKRKEGSVSQKPAAEVPVNRGIKNGKREKRSLKRQMQSVNQETHGYENNFTSAVKDGNDVQIAKPVAGFSSPKLCTQTETSAEIASSLGLNLEVSSNSDTRTFNQLSTKVGLKSVNKTPVGRRIIVAASNLRQSGNKQRSAVSLFGFRAAFDATSAIRRSIFEISDSDD